MSWISKLKGVADIACVAGVEGEGTGKKTAHEARERAGR